MPVRSVQRSADCFKGIICGLQNGVAGVLSGQRHKCSPLSCDALASGVTATSHSNKEQTLILVFVFRHGSLC